MHDFFADHALPVFRVVGRISVAVVRFVFVQVLVDVVLFNFGRLALLLVTAGRYPRGRMLQAQRQRIAACGMLMVVIVWCVAALFNHFAAA